MPHAMLTRRDCLALLGAGAAGAAPAWSAAPPDAYPARPVRIVVPCPLGEPADAIARRLADALTRRMGQPFVLDHCSSADGTPGSEAVAKAASDGHTLLFTSGDTPTNADAMHARLPGDAARNLSFVTVLGSLPLVFAVHASVPARDMAEFARYARAKYSDIAYGSTGDGGTFHVAADRLLNRHLRAGAAHVPYRGLAPLAHDLASGHIHAAFGVPSAFVPFARSDQLRILGTGGGKRLAGLPQVRTFAEQGFDDAALDARVWLAMLAPAATPTSIVERLHAQIVRALDEPEVAAILARSGVEPMRTTPQQARAFVDRDVATLAR